MHSDVVLEVEDEEFHVHKHTLSMYSTFFNCLFTSDFREKQQNKIPLPGKAKEHIREFLNVLYLNSTVGESNYEILLALADEYQADQVTRQCRKFLWNSLNDNNCLKYYRLACKYGLNNVRKKALPLARKMNFLTNARGYISTTTRTEFRVNEDYDYELLEDKDKLCLLENRVLELAYMAYHCSSCRSREQMKECNNVCEKSKTY